MKNATEKERERDEKKKRRRQEKEKREGCWESKTTRLCFPTAIFVLSNPSKELVKWSERGFFLEGVCGEGERRRRRHQWTGIFVVRTRILQRDKKKKKSLLRVNHWERE